MNACVIQHMCDQMPPPGEDVLVDNYSSTSIESLLGKDDPKLTKFLNAYKNLQFGWTFAQTQAYNDLPIGVVLKNQDTAVWRAYLYNRDPQKYRDKTLLQALSFTHPTKSKDKALLNALIMTQGATVEHVASTLNIPKNVVAVYEKLFFNVLDRKEDHMFISSIVYPQGRLVEFYDRYTDTETLDMLLMRAGYNHGAKDLLYLAGFHSDVLQKYEGKDTPARLESLIMANGLMLAKNGWLNQGPGSSMGMYQARQLLAAAKAGGGETQESPFYDKNPGRTVLADFHRHRSETLARRQDFTITAEVIR